MPDFQYTVRTDDLSLRPSWQPHDDWNLRSVEPGGEDRDRQIEDYLATLSGPTSTLVNPVKFGGVATNVTSTGTWEVDGPWINMLVGATFIGAPAAGNLTIDLPKPTIVVPGANNAIIPWGTAGPLSQGVQWGPVGHVGDTASIVVSTMRIFSGAAWAGWTQLVPYVWKATDGLAATIRYRWK